MAHQNMQFAQDSAMVLQAAGTTNTTTGNGSLFVDLGSGYQEVDVIFDVTAVAVGTGEFIAYSIQGSNDTGFGALVTYRLGTITFGDTASIGQPVDTCPGTRHVVHVNNVVHPSASVASQQETVRYMRISWVRGGAAGSCTAGIFATYQRR
jgi:hypothetical protein